MKPKTPLRVVVLSSTTFGYMCIKQGILQAPGIQLAGILTTPKEIDISYSEKPVVISSHANFHALAATADCEVEIMTGKMDTANYLQYLERWRPDMILALGWYFMIPQKVRMKAPLGCAGIHASLLPKYRGGAPISWAIINGEKESGVTFFYLEDGVDDGDIIAQERFPIEDSDTCASVYEKVNQASINILQRCLPQLASGAAARTPQDESHATYFPQRKPEDGLIDWNWEPQKIHNFVRAQTKPYPGAYTYIEGKKVIIWDALVCTDDDA